MDISLTVKAYTAIRERRHELKAAFEAEYNDLGAKLERLEAELLKHLQVNKANSVSTDFGTIYRQELVKPSCQDWGALDAWKDQHPEYGASDVMEKRLSKKFIEEYMEANEGNLPPGVSVYREYVVRVRKN